MVIRIKEKNKKDPETERFQPNSITFLNDTYPSDLKMAVISSDLKFRSQIEEYYKDKFELKTFESFSKFDDYRKD